MNTSDDARAMVAAYGCAWPDAHPATGEPFVGVSIEQTRAVEREWLWPPGPEPALTIDVYDADGEYVGEHELSDEDYAERVARWQRYRNEYAQAGAWPGARYLMRAGAIETRGTFTTSSGSEVSGVWAGDRWVWDSWSVAGVGRAPR